MEKIIEVNVNLHLKLYVEDESEIRDKLTIIQHQINQLYSIVNSAEICHYRVLELTK